MGYPYDSTEARQLNHDILATIYYGALEASSELAETLGTYDQYKKRKSTPIICLSLGAHQLANIIDGGTKNTSPTKDITHPQQHRYKTVDPVNPQQYNSHWRKRQ